MFCLTFGGLNLYASVSLSLKDFKVIKELKKINSALQSMINLDWQCPKFYFLDHEPRGAVGYALVKWSA